MSTILSKLTFKVARELKVTVEGYATGGAVGSLTDANYLINLYPDSYFLRGSLWILHDAAGAGAAPEGEHRLVTGFTKATGVVTVNPDFSAAPASGDYYALADQRYPLYQIIGYINNVLSEWFVPTIDTSLTTAAAQTEYTLPAAIQNLEGLEVWLQTYTSDTDDNRYRQISGWRVEETALGTAKTLVFDRQLPTGRVLKLVYYLPHPFLYVGTDKLHEWVDPQRVALEAAYRLLLARKAHLADQDPDTNMLIQELQGRMERAKWRNPNRRNQVKLASLGIMDGEV